MPVPNTRQVIPGAAVSIVLKADQRTGREVQGIVKDVLTRGDHHRGIKVRMTDGRIGRVQRMDTGRSADASETAPAVGAGTLVSGTSESSAFAAAGDAPPPPRFAARRGKFRDIRMDEPLEAPQEQIGLDAYIVAPKRKGKGRKSKQAEDEISQSQSANTESAPVNVATATVTCPVCGVFEGDEAAVAHHVSEHFE